MTYRLSIESNIVGRDVPFFLLGVYDDEKIARLDAVGLMNFFQDEIKTIGLKKFDGKKSKRISPRNMHAMANRRHYVHRKKKGKGSYVRTKANIRTVDE